MNAYARPDQLAGKLPKLPAPLTSRDIDKLFKRAAGWFDRDRVRKRLYAKGFPHPIERGRWSRIAVMDWLATAGANPGNVPHEGKRTTRKRQRRSGYANVA
jgi:hypothetical protein